jgi:DNA uptake protein ComE-like DNA-binding protein
MNRNDRKTALAALAVLLLAVGALFLTGRHGDEAVPLAADSLQQTPLAVERSDSRGYQPYAVAPTRQPELFPFDPNTADSTQLLRLGLQPWQVRNIYKYRAHGGIYRQKSDFARLYGLTVKEYRRLEPYIHISSDYQPAATLVGERQAIVYDTVQRPVKLQEGETVDLNTADTTLLRRVPGIGHYYASEIVRYRQWLGGYVSADQLDEIDNFPAAAKSYFTASAAHVQHLNVNQLSLQQLRRHPYINFYQAKTIVEYRRLRGPLKSLNELRLSKDFPPEAIERLAPYVVY